MFPCSCGFFFSLRWRLLCFVAVTCLFGSVVICCIPVNHDDVIKWKHIPRLWPFVWGIRWIPRTDSGDAKLYCFLLSAPEQTFKQSRRRWFETSSRPLWRHCNDSLLFLAATKQLYEWFSPSVRPPRPSVTHFSLCSHHRIIMKFSGLITSDRSDVHAKDQGQRSKVKVTEVKT